MFSPSSQTFIEVDAGITAEIICLRMLWLWLFTFLLLFTIHVRALYLVSEGQTVLDAEPLAEEGVLSSFVAQPARGWTVEDILDAAETANADVWHVSPSHVDVYFSTIRNYHESQLKAANLSESTRIIDRSLLSATPYPTSAPSWNLSSLSNTTFHASYHPLYEVENFMEELATLNPHLVQLANLGHSAEGREMFAIKISRDTLSQKSGSSAQGKAKTGIVVTGAQHAREWVATSTALYLAHALVASAAEPYAMSSLLDDHSAVRPPSRVSSTFIHEFYIIPLPNPDGYAYTWEHDRLWYKNRQILGPNEKCVGLDMNRQGIPLDGHKWKPTARFPRLKAADPSTSNSRGGIDPCTQWYPGHRPFQSPEVNNIANYITTLPALQVYIDLRSYGQMLSAPFSYSCKKMPKDAENLSEAALGATRAIKLVHGTTFTTGGLCSMLYKAPGNVVDWMYAKAGVPYSYAVHLRDTGTYGFSLPAEWIRPVGEETASMIQFLAEFTPGGRKCALPLHPQPECSADNLLSAAELPV
ncbi:hypothetical protein BKA93DRAFT_931543 [Sparassis latifolia]